MKLIKIIAVTFTLTLIFVMPNKIMAQTVNKSILIIRAYEGEAKEKWTKIIVTENETKLEEIPLLPFNLENIESNQLALGKNNPKICKYGL